MASQVLVNLLNEYFLSRYCNNRIIMFSKDGTYISEWGERSKSVLGKCFQKRRKALSLPFLYNLFSLATAVQVKENPTERMKVYEEYICNGR